jgi:tetratricopeptide (TPR) repeat protein
LVDTESGRQLWAERYDRSGADIFLIEDDIIKAVVASLAIEVDSAERSRIMATQTQNPMALEGYYKALKLFETYTRQGVRDAIVEWEKVTQLDPTFARAYSWLGYAHLEEYKEGWSDSADESYRLAVEFATKAADLAPLDYYTHWTLATVYMERKEDHKLAFDAYKKAFDLNPKDADLLASRANLLSFRDDPGDQGHPGDVDTAIEHIEEALVLNPKVPDWYRWSLGLAYFQKRRYQDAVTALEQMSDLPNEAYLLLAASKARLSEPIPPDVVLARLREKDPDWNPNHLDRLPFEKEEDQQHWFKSLEKAGVLPAESKNP